MLSSFALRELQTKWLPNLSDQGLDRLIELLETGSPLLIHGCFTKATPMGCLATHAGWHHPRTAHLTSDAGIFWLTRVAGLNPATSQMIREWDCGAPDAWQIRSELADILRNERKLREQRSELETSLEPALT
jgi:hypothetical protein